MGYYKVDKPLLNCLQHHIVKTFPLLPLPSKIRRVLLASPDQTPAIRNLVVSNRDFISTIMSVALNCSCGTLEIELFLREAPRTCRNFIELCKAGYYDGILFHRVVPNFMCQTGDPEGTGKGGESIYGPRFDDEMSAKLSHDRKGILSMANYGRNTNSSQFFIIFRPSPHLDGKHTIFGRVKPESLPVLDSLQQVKVKDNKPITPVKLFVAEVLQDPWEGEALPLGSCIPPKPLLAPTSQGCIVQ